MYYYSQQTINNNMIVNTELIIDTLKNANKQALVTLCLEVDNKDNLTPIIFIDEDNLGYSPYDNKKYVLPNNDTVVNTFKKYLTNKPKYLYTYYHDNKYYYISSFKNGDYTLKMLKTILEPVEDLIEQKKKLIFGE